MVEVEAGFALDGHSKVDDEAALHKHEQAEAAEKMANRILREIKRAFLRGAAVFDLRKLLIWIALEKLGGRANSDDGGARRTVRQRDPKAEAVPTDSKDTRRRT